VRSQESDRCVWPWLNDRERAEEVTGKGRAAAQGLCLTWRSPGLAPTAGSFLCLLRGMPKRCFQGGSRQQRRALTKTALARQPAVTWHPDGPRGAAGVAPRPLGAGRPRVSLAASGQSCSRWQADDNEISNISKIIFSETDLTTLSPPRTLGKVNPFVWCWGGRGQTLLLRPSRAHPNTAVREHLPRGRQWAEVLAGVQLHACFWEMLREPAAKTPRG